MSYQALTQSIKLTHQQLLRIITAAWFTPGRAGSASSALNDEDGSGAEVRGNTWDLPLLIQDDPGTGKTSAIEVLARHLGFTPVTIALNNRQPEDVGGYPVPNRTRTGMTKLPDTWVDTVNSAKRAVVIFDEFTVSPEHQAAALRVFSERMAGEVRLGGHVRRIALANPPESAATPHDLTAPAANRFGHLAWSGFSEAEFGDWLLSGGSRKEIVPIDPDALEKRVLSEWTGAYAKAAAIVRGYLRSFPQHLHKMPKTGEADQLRWPSRRTWEMATLALASSFVHHLTADETAAFIGAFLPEYVTTSLAAFRQDEDFGTPQSYLDGDVEFVPTKRVDRTFAILEMCASYLCDKTVEHRRERALKWWAMADMVADHKYGSKDYVMAAARIMAEDPAKGGAGLGSVALPEINPIVNKITPVLLAQHRAMQATKERTRSR